MKNEGMNIPPQGVFVVWKWEWTVVEESESEEEEDSREQRNPHLHSDSESDNGTELSPPDFLPTQTHTVTFKCIGTVHDNDGQVLLSRISKMLREDGKVEVRVSPEPDNEHDSQAIAFQCHVNHKWQRIGYVVRECLSHVTPRP